MNQLKFLLLVIFIVQCVFSCAPTTKIAKDHNNIPYIGIWEHEDGNNVFRLTLKEDTELDWENRYWIIGHYEMVKVDPVTGEEQTLYTSRPRPLPERMTPIQGFIRNHSNNLAGQFQEFHARMLFGSFEISIEPSCHTCLPKIKWELERSKVCFVIQKEGDPPYVNTFEVPTNIILEKVN